MRKIRFGELHLSDLSKREVTACLENEWCSLGPVTEKLEKSISALFGYKGAVAMSSGTAGDTAACMVMHELSPEKKYIICPALSFIASATSICQAGFYPMFVDVGEDMQIDIDKLVDCVKINKGNIAAMMAVNLMGKPCKLEKIKELADEYHLPVIVDGCESYGCQRQGKLSLEYASMEVISMYVAHLLSGGTEGGAVFSNDESILALLTAIRSHGRPGGSLYFNHEFVSGNFKPTDIHSALISGSVPVFWDVFETRKQIFNKILSGLFKYSDICSFVEEEEGDVNAPHAFSITLKEPYNKYINILYNGLISDGIECKINFGCIPGHAAFTKLGFTNYYPVATRLGRSGLHFACHQYLSEEDIDYIIIICSKWLDLIRKS